MLKQAVSGQNVTGTRKSYVRLTTQARLGLQDPVSCDAIEVRFSEGSLRYITVHARNLYYFWPGREKPDSKSTFGIRR